jgi:hypothetical protein
MQQQCQTLGFGLHMGPLTFYLVENFMVCFGLQVVITSFQTFWFRCRIYNELTRYFVGSVDSLTSQYLSPDVFVAANTLPFHFPR